MFKSIPSYPDFPQLEHRILKFWDQIRAFDKLREKNKNGPKFSFIDGPITANNPMGVHHAWGRTYKDIYQRYKAMQGYCLRYQNGFDCQGLWVEVEVEKELGFNSKRDIEGYGIARFVEKCKERVRRYSQIQTQQSIRLGYWMDWDNSYYTMSNENNYCIWHFLKKCHQQSWIYKGHDVMPWCPRCGTAISEHEIATEGYRELVHPSVYLRFPLLGRKNEYLLVWTTTPWTLTSNVAVAVHPELIYVRARQGDDCYYLSEGALSVLKGGYEITGRMKGSELSGLRYRGPFDELQAQRGVEHKVINWKGVSEEEGTGMVHIAPGCGKEDFELAKEFDLAVIAPLDEFGSFVEGFNWLRGRSASEVAGPIYADLEKKGILYKREEYLHRYPVCWRCESELVFRLVDEWFISMDELRYRIMDVARKVNWIPEFGLDRELDWLRNMHDWCISKKRYWGLALPIYECNCGHFEVIGGEMELEERAIEGWKSFEGHSPHRPWIDAVKIKCPECGSKVSRIPDVGNPWLDAGIVPYSTLDYRHNRSYWKEWFPAEFITECFHQQFRNWFYSLLAMSTVLEGREPFQTVLGHARVLDENGEEMHKSRGNAIWFDEAAERMGVEVMRWMFARQNPAVNLNFGYGAAEEVKRNFLTLWNSYSFFVTYANLDRFDPTKEQVDPRDRSLLDRWLLARLNLLIQTARTQMDRYNVAGVVRAVDDFIEGLSNWYIRRSRRRFWKSENDRDKAAAYLTLYETLVSLCKILAPILPFLAEELYQNLVRTQDPLAPESLHLCDYPVPDTDMIDPGLLEDMEWAIKVVNLARSARNKAGVKIRQPLSQLIIAVDDQKVISAIGRTEFLIKEEVNVKGISFVTDLSQILTLNARPNFKVLGPRLGKLAGKVAEKIKGLGSEEIALISKGSAVEVEVAGKSLRIEPEDVEIVASEKDLVSESEDHLTVALDTTLTEALLDEGFAREFIHKIQNMRKAAGFAIADRINIYYQTTDRLRKAVEVFEDHIKAETLCIGFMEGDKRGDLRESCRINGEPAEIAVERIPDHG